MAKWWLLANLVTIIVLAFYSMIEMAIVSLNKVRLQYYVNLNSKKAIRIKELLNHPTKLFGTTLIGVNLATIVGSECSREFHQALGIDPNFAPLSQVIIVIIFGELAPMFAARQYPEHVSMLGINLLFLSSKLMTPFVWFLEKISKFVLKIMGNKDNETSIFLSQDELVKIIEEQTDDYTFENEEEESTIIPSNIFHLNKKNIGMVMTPLNDIPLLPSDATIMQMKNFLTDNPKDYVLLYNKQPKNITHIAQPRDMLRAVPAKKVKDFSKSPWFIVKENKLGDILRQFRTNKKKFAVVLDEKGDAVGAVTRDALLFEIFGKTTPLYQKRKANKKVLNLQEYTLHGSMLIRDFNKKFNVSLEFDQNATLSDLIVHILGHSPETGDHVTIQHFEMTIKEATFFGVKTLTVTSIS